MKKIIKIVKNNIFGFILGVVIAVVISTYAATQLASSSVYYDNTKSGGSSNTVSGAIDELYDMANSYKRKKCERATLLHTEVCNQTSDYCAGDGYSNGDTITYGNLGTSGTLATGDAFDCDVNGDGVYDATTERFYYVSDMTNGVTSDSDTAVLIYYNNVSGGKPSNSTAYAYDSSGSNNNGPVTAITQLPTTSQWSNVSLKSTKRYITNDASATRVSGFSYEGYAARLLTYQEVQTGCYDEISNKCKFLMENTKYSVSLLATSGSWLESPFSSNSISAWIVYGHTRTVGYISVYDAGYIGVRPAIEVSKSDISY